jgi:membrane protease YdiL (CAAX protease family)
MPKALRETGPPAGGFLAALLLGWAVLGAAGVWYARFKGIPDGAAFPLLAAFLAEYPFYLVLGFPSLRERLAGRALPLWVVAAALLPYGIACAGAIQFQPLGLARVAGFAAVLGLWYVVLPAVAAVDLVFLAILPAALLGAFLAAAMPPAVPVVRKEVEFLAHLILLVMALLVLMLGRRVPETGFGFLPTAREWRIGALHFLSFLAAGLPLALALGAAHWRTPPAPAWKVAGTFVGLLWVIALSEEFFFRGVLMTWIAKWTRSAVWALLITSAIFGLIHLGYARQFPNWRWALLAGWLGWCCGHARNQAGGIRAGVVTHALTVAAWRAFFS